MKKITSAFVEIVDLESLGWDFNADYHEDARFWGISFEEARRVMHEKFHIRIDVLETGTFWRYVSRSGADEGEPLETGDDEQTMKNLDELWDADKLWGVEME